VLRDRTIFQFQPQQPKIWVPSNEPPPLIEGLTISLHHGVQPGLVVDPSWIPGKYEDNPKKSSLTTWELAANGKFVQLDEVELAHESSFHLFGNLGVVYERANQPRLLDLSEPSALRILGFLGFEGAPSLNYEFADGAADRGLWIPTGQYGLEAFIFPP
jgi:hypothetical protein